ncbi:hypothetical protein RRG08_005372 [Elysia crispata]|uniref:Fucolectin tachylectin-4 pentraxin-1 domain-containing protein n=1 Tax=Elysia crispata TaxID=231223 RepID=A0AAE1B3P4_9GAST|nr:hypothetical protein RRG08_005372 [Elysia crispata]
MIYLQKGHNVRTTGLVPTASTSVTVLGLLHVIKTMVPVAQAVTRTGLDRPVNMHGHTVKTAGSAPTASTSVTVLGLLHVINTMVPVAQAVTGTGLGRPVNMHVQTAGLVPAASTSATVLGLLHVIKTMDSVAQAVIKTGLDLPVNMSEAAKWLTDMNDKTCNEGGTSALNVTLKTAIPLLWIRVVVNNTVKNNKIFLNYNVNGTNEVLECGSTDSTAVVNDRTYDIVCDTQNPVEEFYLFGTGVKSLCSLYISAGRNVALKQQTKQSSTNRNWTSSHAVDGRLGKNNKASQKATCTHTKAGNPGWWRLTFSQPVDVSMFHIYNRKAWGSKGYLLYSHTDQDKSPTNIYIVIPNTMIRDVHVLEIHSEHKTGILTMCEVEVFGDVSVSVTVGTKNTAALSTVVIVHLALRLATWMNTVQNVPEEQTDLTVQNPAAQAVKIQTTVMGHVSTDVRMAFKEPHVTLDGFQGATCNVECESGNYGAGCGLTCSVNCAGRDHPCDHITGECNNKCDPGYIGKTCDQGKKE